MNDSKTHLTHTQEGLTNEQMDRFTQERSARMQANHHEIYLTAPSRTALKKNKTVIHHPF